MNFGNSNIVRGFLIMFVLYDERPKNRSETTEYTDEICIGQLQSNTNPNTDLRVG